MTSPSPNTAPQAAPFRVWAALFAVVQAAALLFVFRDALWGRAILAPVDIAGTLLTHYKFVSPNLAAPDNHYIIDQLTYDLPLQHTIYEAYRRGEIPWWDPYTYAGRPLLADAHINGADPWRVVVDQVLPFVLAYNWTPILHFLTAGAGMWLLLRRLGVGEAIALGVALAWEFAGCHVIKIGHPWLLGAFSWYPWLWLALHAGWEGGGRGPRAGAALAVAAIFLAGNAQSHAYLPLFFAAWVLGYAGLSRDGVMRALRVALPVAVVGGCLAAPVLFSEVEFYRLNVRLIDQSREQVANPWIAPWLSVVGMLHPWLLGTFHTFDASKLGGLGLWAMGFRLFAGPVVLAGAVLACWPGEAPAGRPAPTRTALWLVGAYFAILGTPLVVVLYPRAAGLGALGLCVLSALGLERLRRSAGVWRTPARLIFIWLCLLTVGAHVLAFVIWPKVKPRLEARIQAQIGKAGLGPAPELRARQLANFPAETSFANSEGLIAAVGWLAFGAALVRPAWRQRPGFWPALLTLNLIPMLLFAARYVPRHDVAMWDRLLAGGEEQRAVAAALNPSGARLWEPEVWMRFHLYPGALGHLYGVRTIAGYSALRPPNLAELPEPGRSNLLATLGDPVYVEGAGGGQFHPGRADARFQWKRGGGETPRFTQQGLNGFRLDFTTPQAGVLLWTDTWYPGWSVRAEQGLVDVVKTAPCFSQVTVAQPTRSLEFRYRPRLLTAGMAVALAGCLGLVLLLGFRGPGSPAGR